MIKNYISLLLVLFIGVASYCQERSNYQLLWEISNNDSSKKSYLFGTMHVKDERAFQFPDALVPAIESTEVFALEIDPDKIITKLLKKLTDTSYENIYKRILSPAEYKKLKNRFFEVNEIDLDSFPMQHPMMIESMLIKEKSKPTDRRTFVDAFLYSIAFQFNKEISGLEDFEDQFPSIENISEEELREDLLYVIENSPQEQDDFLEQMVATYYSGDLNKILEFMNIFGQNNAVMIARNNKMVKSMDSIMETKTLFSAVGAAHLPGEKGIITLLRNEGYTVNLVPPTFIKDNSRFELIPNLERWPTYEAKSLGYSLQTPTEGTVSKQLKGSASNSSIDLISGYEFTHFGVDSSTRSYPEGFNMMEGIIEGQLKNKNVTLVSKKSYKIKDFDVTEIITKTEEKANRMQIYFDKRYVYIFNAEGPGEEINSTYVNAFFNSVRVFEPQLPATEWTVHQDSIGAFSISIPGKMKDISQTIQSPEDESVTYDLDIFTVLDTEKRIFSLLRYNDQPNGYYLQDEALFRKEFDHYFNKKGTIIGEPLEFTIEGNRAVSYEVLLSNKYHTRGTIIFRGNRVYLLLSQSLDVDKKVNSDYLFLNSLKFRPYKNSSFYEPLIVDKNYKIDFPGTIKNDIENEYGLDSEFEFTEIYSSADPTTGGAYLFQKTRLKPYAKSVSKEQYLNDYSEQLLEWQDTLISSQNIMFKGMPAKELTIYNEKTLVRQKLLLVQHNNNLFTLICYLGDEETDRATSFFDGFEILKKQEKFDITSSKTKQLFKDLKSKDSLVFRNAESAFDYYIFDKEDNQLLLKNLFHTFSDNEEYYGIKYRVLDELATLDLGYSVKKITTYYKNETSNKLKVHALTNLGAFSQLEAQQKYMSILKNNLPIRDENTQFDIFDKIPDPTAFIIKEEATLSTLVASEVLRDKIINMYATNILNDSVYKDAVPKFKEVIRSYFLMDAKRYVDTLERKKYQYINNSLMNTYVNIIKKESYTSPIALETLLILAEGPETKNWIQKKALINAINTKLEIPQKLISKTLNDLYSRFEVMEALINMDQKEKIPSRYFESKSFSKIGIFNAAGEDYDTYPDYIEYLGDFTKDGINYHAYKYGWEYDTEETFLGYSEAKVVDLTNFEANDANATWEVLKEDWKTQALRLME